MQKNLVENIISIIKKTKGMLIIGFIDNNSIVDNLILREIKSALNTMSYNIEIIEFDAELIDNNYNYFNLITIPTYNIYYNSVLLDQFDIIDTGYDIRERISALIIN